MKRALLLFFFFYILNAYGSSMELAFDNFEVSQGQVVEAQIMNRSDRTFSKGEILNLEQELGIVFRENCPPGECKCFAIPLGEKISTSYEIKGEKSILLTVLNGGIKVAATTRAESFQYLKIPNKKKDFNWWYIAVATILLGGAMVFYFYRNRFSKKGIREQITFKNLNERECIELVYKKRNDLMGKYTSRDTEKIISTIIDLNFKEHLSNSDLQYVLEHKKTLEEFFSDGV